MSLMKWKIVYKITEQSGAHKKEAERRAHEIFHLFCAVCLFLIFYSSHRRRRSFVLVEDKIFSIRKK